MNLLKELAGGLIHLAYPAICESCGHVLNTGEEVICLHCEYKLPRTRFHLHAGNEMEKKFYGRVRLNRAVAFCFFVKEGNVQHLIHGLKYKDQTHIGNYLGKLFGLELKGSDDFKSIDLILPVPLHKKKEKIRGYNQSDFIASGLSEGMQIPWDKTILIRTVSTQSQTRKGRLERWRNVESIFKIKKPELISGKHILLVDDVMTTGSTLEASAIKLIEAGARVSVATLGYAAK